MTFTTMFGSKCASILTSIMKFGFKELLVRGKLIGSSDCSPHVFKLTFTVAMNGGEMANLMLFLQKFVLVV